MSVFIFEFYFNTWPISVRNEKESFLNLVIYVEGGDFLSTFSSTVNNTFVNNPENDLEKINE